MKVAVVCDSMSAYGGAERVIEQILNTYPHADLFTVLDVVPKAQRGFLGNRPIKSSFLQRLPAISSYYRNLLALWPIAVEQLDVTDYELVISSHHSVAYGVLTCPGQVHVSYVHSPMRYAWDLHHQYLRQSKLGSGLRGIYARHALHGVRIWDYAAAQRPDAIATNSRFVSERLWKTHRREAEVIYPPVDLRARPLPRYDGGYYLSIGRLVPYKRVDLLARAFALLPHQRLKIVGEGPELRRIAALSLPNVEVLGFQPTETVHRLLAGARAYMFAGIEDFGIAAVEAQAAGVPVIGYRAGGLTETICSPGLAPAPTGLFFDTQSEAAIAAAVTDFEKMRDNFQPAYCIANAQRFGIKRFRRELTAFVEAAIVTNTGKINSMDKLERSPSLSLGLPEHFISEHAE